MKAANIEVSYVDHMGSDNSVASAARVSFDKVAENYTPEQNDKLIKYLARNKHFSPFNHTFITVRVKAPIYVARQLVKHEYMPWNEVSRRYVDSEPEFFFPEVRAKADNVKQGSAGLHHHHLGWDSISRNITLVTLNTYKQMIEDGVCPEQARAILPANMMTEWIWSGTLKAFHKMLSLRLDPHTQAETRLVAEACREIILSLYPISLSALLENN